MLNYQDWKKLDLNEAKLPDIGETVAFEDEVDVKINGKKMTIKPNQEVEVVSTSGNQMELKCKSGVFHLTLAEYKAHGGYLV